MQHAAENSARYIRAFHAETDKASHSSELIAALKKRSPSLQDTPSLELSAKVAMGGMEVVTAPGQATLKTGL